MICESDLDTLLATALAPPRRDDDHGFVKALQLQVAERERFRQQRRRMWREGAAQASGLVALVIGLIRFSRLPVFAGIGLPSGTPLGIAPPLVLVLGLWLATSGVLTPPGGPARTAFRF